MNTKEGTNSKTEVWTIVLAITTVVVTLSGVMIFFLMSS